MVSGPCMRPGLINFLTVGVSIQAAPRVAHCESEPCVPRGMSCWLCWGCQTAHCIKFRVLGLCVVCSNEALLFSAVGNFRAEDGWLEPAFE